MTFFTIVKELWRGKDLYRIFMNEECARHTIGGVVLDIGSGTTLASYHRFLKKLPDTAVECLDLGFINGVQHIDLETDRLPRINGSVDTVLLFNILEHIYRYQVVLCEIRRILKPNGHLLGAVPLLVAYHPDPHDYWRYTKETLEKIFMEVGFKQVEIRPFGYGPAVAAFFQIEVALPRLVKILLVPGVLLCDWVITKMKPQFGKEKFGLGLFFQVLL